MANPSFYGLTQVNAGPERRFYGDLLAQDRAFLFSLKNKEKGRRADHALHPFGRFTLTGPLRADDKQLVRVVAYAEHHLSAPRPRQETYSGTFHDVMARLFIDVKDPLVSDPLDLANLDHAVMLYRLRILARSEPQFHYARDYGSKLRSRWLAG